MSHILYLETKLFNLTIEEVQYIAEKARIPHNLKNIKKEVGLDLIGKRISGKKFGKQKQI